MKIPKILALALSAGTLFAQTPTQELDARIQVFGEMIRPSAFDFGNPTIYSDQADRSVGVGIRFMGELAAARNFYYELGGKLDSTSNLTFNQVVAPTGNVDLTHIHVTSSYWSLGVGYLVPLGANASLGFHLEGRAEALTAAGTKAVTLAGSTTYEDLNIATTYLRPWGRLSLDVSWRMGKLRPFLGADVSGTPVKTTQSTPLLTVTDMNDRTLRAMAPNVAGAVYFGLHF